MEKEYIICSAIWYNDGKKHAHQPVNVEHGLAVAGRRHHNCIATISALKNVTYSRVQEIQGFLTNADRFVDRHDAMAIALAPDQIKADQTHYGHGLDSSNLY